MISLPDLLIILLAIGFTCMGCVALFTPGRIVEQFDITALSAAGRNEIRAVYGGFGLAMASLLIVALIIGDLRHDICLSISIALLGMASGRVVSVLIDRTMAPFPRLYFVLECIGGALLFYARIPA